VIWLRSPDQIGYEGLIVQRTWGVPVSKERDRDVEKVYSTSEFISKLRRLADALETGERFEIQVAGERVYVPARAEFNVEHERDGNEEEIEFQLRWTNQ
jgi:amphi-Trp domain-containing protein